MSADRLPVAKTYKLFVGGAFIRSEGGKVLHASGADGRPLASYCRATRKDLRGAVEAARKAQAGWARRSAFNRSQILFRIAEMLESRRATFEQGLIAAAGLSRDDARARLTAAIDRVFWYSGWADKFAQVLGNVNPIATPFFNFTLSEPTGVVGIVAPRTAPVLGVLSALMPVLVGGNAAVVAIENDAPHLSLELGELFATSDVPAGVVNLLSGTRAELVPTLAAHRDVDALACFREGADELPAELVQAQRDGAESVKRVRILDAPASGDWTAPEAQSLYWIEPFIEWKTTWHPIGV